MSRVTRDTCHDNNAQSPGVTRPGSQVSRLRRLIRWLLHNNVEKSPAVRVFILGKNVSAMMNKHSTQTDEGCADCAVCGDWRGVIVSSRVNMGYAAVSSLPCLSQRARENRDHVMIVALCDMTEVSSDDKYDASVTLTTAIMARPSEMSVDSCHNERVTPLLLAVSRRDENNEKNTPNVSIKKPDV